MNPVRKRPLLAIGLRPFLLCALAIPAAPLVAQQDVLEEIIVTARKREEGIQDVPISVNAQMEAQIRNSGATNLEELSNNVAGFTVQNLGPGQSQVAMRGTSSGQIVRDQPGVKEEVGMYLDDSVLSLSLFTPDLELFDLNRVEVLRGPQGTLFGSGSLSGTVRYITNQPNLDEYELIGEGTINDIDEGGFGGGGKGVFNVPLVQGQLALRAVGYYTKLAGFIDAIQPDGSVDSNVNDGERFGGRVSLRWQPTDSVTITPRVVYQEVNMDGFNREDEYNILANPFTTAPDQPAVTIGDREQFTQFEEKFEDEFLLADATIEVDFNGVGLPAVFTGIASFTDRDIVQLRDATQLTGSVTGGNLALPSEIYNLDAPLFDVTSLKATTFEARLASTGDSRLEWLAGLFLSDIEREYGQSLPVTGFEALANPILGTPAGFTAGPRAAVDELFFSDIPYNFDQFAWFTEGTLHLTDRLRFTAGVRWFDFDEERVLNFDGIFADQVIGLEGTTSSDGVAPRFILSYDLTDNITANAQAAKGFRLGGINDPLNIPLCSPQDLVTFGGFDSWEDETLWNYELGLKTTFWDGRGTFNIAGFYTDIDDLQATLTAGTCSSRIIFNVPSARSVGVEAELFVQPTDFLDFGMSGSYTDAELRSTVTTTLADGSTGPVGGIEKGNRLPTTPKFQFAAHASYFQPVFTNWEGFITGTFQHVGSRFTQVGDQRDFPPPPFGVVDLTIFPLGNPAATTFTFDPKMDSYNIGNLRLGLRNEKYEVAFFINNIWDERARLAVDQERGTLARVGFLTNQPRTFGLTTRVNFY
ncbi:MAG: TonB-dependent receptor [Gammaproteobacteria bacterium]|nr:TonB-dependent receptor [Gammaproteobacteria bacterium]